MVMNFFLLQLLIATKQGSHFLCSLGQKENKINKEIVDKLFQNKGFFVVCDAVCRYLEAI